MDVDESPDYTLDDGTEVWTKHDELGDEHYGALKAFYGEDLPGKYVTGIKFSDMDSRVIKAAALANEDHLDEYAEELYDEEALLVDIDDGAAALVHPDEAEREEAEAFVQEFLDAVEDQL